MDASHAVSLIRQGINHDLFSVPGLFGFVRTVAEKIQLYTSHAES